jgi:hypothetical protein
MPRVRSARRKTRRTILRGYRGPLYIETLTGGEIAQARRELHPLCAKCQFAMGARITHKPKPKGGGHERE